jgi:hypothetical protein
MSKNSRTYWYEYDDIDAVLKSKSNDYSFYYVEDTASQNSEQALQRIDDSFATLEANVALKATVIPINLGRIVEGKYEGSHWVGVVLRRNVETLDIEALYNDSLGTPMDDSVPFLRQILKKHDVQNDNIRDFRKKQQDNGYDCGAWTVLNLDSLARTGLLPNATEIDVIMQRQEVFGYCHNSGGAASAANAESGSADLGHNEASGEPDSESNASQLDESDTDAQDYDNPLLELEELKISDQNHIKFILNVPMYVPASNMDEASSDDTDDESFIADQFAFNIQDPPSFPYRTFDVITKPSKSKKKNKPEPKKVMESRVGLLEVDLTIDEPLDKDQVSLQHSRTDKLLKLLATEGFDEVDKDYISNIAVSIGLNRHKSLSNRKNDCLKKELHRTEDKSPISFKKAAFFWDMPWVDQEGEKTLYEEVRKFYKQLKRKDADKAKEFLKLNEESHRPSPPYQQIREYVKNHENTKELVRTLRTDGSIMYFSSIDSDTKSFNGIYSSYLKIIAKSQEPPTVMSTGYEFAEDYDGFPLHVGSKLERIIRIVTEEILSGGAYYPEPNFCVLIPNGQNTLYNGLKNSDKKEGSFVSEYR